MRCCNTTALRSLRFKNGGRCNIRWQFAHTIARSSRHVSCSPTIWASGVLWWHSAKCFPISPYRNSNSKSHTSHANFPSAANTVSFFCFTNFAFRSLVLCCRILSFPSLPDKTLEHIASGSGVAWVAFTGFISISPS